MKTNNTKRHSLQQKTVLIDYDEDVFTFFLDTSEHKTAQILWIYKDIEYSNPVFVKKISDIEIILEWVTPKKNIISKYINLQNNEVSCVYYNLDGAEKHTGRISKIS